MTIDDLKNVISEVAHIPLTEIQEFSSFKEELCIDSLQMVNLIFEVHTRFGVELNKIQSNDDLATVGSMYRAFTKE